MNMLKRNFQAPYVVPILRIHDFVKNRKNFQITSSHLAVLHCMTLNVSVSTAQGRVVRRPGWLWGWAPSRRAWPRGLCAWRASVHAPSCGKTGTFGGRMFNSQELSKDRCAISTGEPPTLRHQSILMLMSTSQSDCSLIFNNKDHHFITKKIRLHTLLHVWL